LLGGASPCSAQDGADSGGKFSWIEWLRKIIVRTNLQAQNSIQIVAARRQHQDGNACLRPNSTQNLKSVHPRQHHIENNQFILTRERALDSLSAGPNGLDSKALCIQKPTNQLAELGVVVDDQDMPCY
jgi:hypothetical protein